MKYKFEISILEVQGLAQGPYEYKIALDSMEQRLYDTDTFEIYGQGNFSLGIYRSNGEVFGFKLPMKLLHGHKSHWFPLGCPYLELDSVEEEFSDPRVLLSITEISVLSPVIERREISEYSLPSTPEIIRTPQNQSQFDTKDQVSAPVKGALMDSIQLELEQKELFCNHVKDLLYASKQEVNKLREVCEGLREQLKKCINDFEEKEKIYINELKEAKVKTICTEEKCLALEVEITKIRNQNSMLKNQISMGQIFSTNIEPKVDLACMLRESEQKRKEIQEELKNAHLRIEANKANDNANSQLHLENQALVNKLNSLAEKLKNDELKNLVQKSDSQRKIEELTAKVQQLENENKAIAQSSQDVSEENYQLKEALDQLRVTLIRQEEENNDLTYQVQTLSEKSAKNLKLDHIDYELKGYLQRLGIKNPFNKISEGVYNFGNKRVSISLRNGAPVIRVGGGYMFIEEFLKVYSLQGKKKADEEENTPKRSRSSEPKLGKSKTVMVFSKEDIENFANASNVSDLMNSSGTLESISKENKIASAFKAKILEQIPKQQTRDFTPVSNRRTPRF
ncbi:unnamed protein product [Blepharisma stoltei]|uniref:GAR domain-containing protein n=1 Tax=Blepharisma stoltei TaxID=1481888 RepID=A0AAU9K2P8_9CILI|nr:unnamed protein product [Blepharisma stoltei]